jgi:hypothetical protein
MQQQSNAATSSDGISHREVAHAQVSPANQHRTLLILLPALALGTALLSSCAPARRLPDSFWHRRPMSRAEVVLQFYVHAIELIDEHGKPHPFRFAVEAPWQNERVALLDLAGDASTPRRLAVSGTVQARRRVFGIRLTVGVPFELNHSNRLQPPRHWIAAKCSGTGSPVKVSARGPRVAGREWSFMSAARVAALPSGTASTAQPCALPNEMRIELKEIRCAMSCVCGWRR